MKAKKDPRSVFMLVRVESSASVSSESVLMRMLREHGKKIRPICVIDMRDCNVTFSIAPKTKVTT